MFGIIDYNIVKLTNYVIAVLIYAGYAVHVGAQIRFRPVAAGILGRWHGVRRGCLNLADRRGGVRGGVRLCWWVVHVGFSPYRTYSRLGLLAKQLSVLHKSSQNLHSLRHRRRRAGWLLRLQRLQRLVQLEMTIRLLLSPLTS